MKNTQKTKKTESGRSMIEMVGVLAVMGLITATAFILITSALNNQRISRVNDDISGIVSGIRTLYATQPTFQNLKGKESDAMATIGYDTVKSPFGESYTLTSDGTNLTLSVDTKKATTCNAILAQLKGVNGCVDASSKCETAKLTVVYNKSGS